MGLWTQYDGFLCVELSEKGKRGRNDSRYVNGLKVEFVCHSPTKSGREYFARSCYCLQTTMHTPTRRPAHGIHSIVMEDNAPIYCWDDPYGQSFFFDSRWLGLVYAADSKKKETAK